MKKINVLLILVLTFNLGFSQTKLAKLTFETDPTDTDPAITDISYTLDRAENRDSGRRYFNRTDGSNISANFVYLKDNDLGDYFFAAQDIDMGNVYSINAEFYLEQFDISGYENLELRVYLAETKEIGQVRGWDNSVTTSGENDYVHFDYDIDETTTFSPLLWIESTGIDGTLFEDNQDAAIDTNFDGTGNGTVITDTFTQYSAAITGTGDLLDIKIEFNLNGRDEDIAIDNIEIWGTLINTTCSGPNITWNGTAWSNGTGPDITTPAVINGTYTTNATNGSFSACELTINGDLTITEDYYIEIEHDVDVSGTLTIENNGTIVQNNDSASFTNSGGTTIFKKSTQILNNWYYYTFWSSPVSGLTIATSPLVNSTKRYWHNANNYLDVYIENNNTDTYTAGSDNIDDNGDDWQFASDTTPMTPGIGFAATHSSSGYTDATSYDYDFIGELNNGVITAPIAYDALNTGGHWNLIGNPYPSALDFDAFVTNNPGMVEGAAYLWSHATPLSATTSGNENLNFSQNDYIIINTGSGSINNSSTSLLEYIPSGESFFIAGLANGNVTFNNAMRIKNPDSNTQFYKSTNAKNKTSFQPNKLWINLTSDIGVFNQVLIAYVDGASDNYDGMAFDAPRNLSSGVASIIYTLIEDKNDTKFAIQGKHIKSINADEIIYLGFDTSIESETMYSLSIDHLQGDFLTENTIYIKDNLLNVSHNLSASNYVFTSDTGEFKDRFEISFKAKALSTNTDPLTTSNQVYIIDLKDGNFKFKTTNGLNIENITIYDLYGRTIYNYEGENNSEIYSLFNLSEATYIAKIELSNHTIVIKKFIKH
ncbi:MAG: T9SS type A sorting domain-containing protein [Algibacter sp.]|uniref:T9SS type A sorting domain-containing protein n=1 Tax=Algibacter sp. TaxID=1872428 RepID=UPI0032983EA5